MQNMLKYPWAWCDTPAWISEIKIFIFILESADDSTIQECINEQDIFNFSFHFFHQIVIKSLFPLFACSQIVNSIDFLEQIYRRNYAGTENQTIFRRFGRIIEPIALFICGDYIWIFILVTTTPIVIYFVNGAKHIIIPAMIPTLNNDIAWQWAINLIFQAYLSLMTCMCYAFFELIFVVQVLHVMLLAQILAKRIREPRMDVREIIIGHIELLEWEKID